jgi:hypothetical protein
MCGLMRIILLNRGECPAGRAHCAWGGHFVACVPDGVALEAWGLALLGVCAR